MSPWIQQHKLAPFIKLNISEINGTFPFLTTKFLNRIQYLPSMYIVTYHSSRSSAIMYSSNIISSECSDIGTTNGPALYCRDRCLFCSLHDCRLSAADALLTKQSILEPSISMFPTTPFDRLQVSTASKALPSTIKGVALHSYLLTPLIHSSSEQV